MKRRALPAAVIVLKFKAQLGTLLVELPVLSGFIFFFFFFSPSAFAPKRMLVAVNFPSALFL
jgi:hypothetical protein